jgi:hypothetical protein
LDFGKAMLAFTRGEWSMDCEGKIHWLQPMNLYRTRHTK